MDKKCPLRFSLQSSILPYIGQINSILWNSEDSFTDKKYGTVKFQDHSDGIVFATKNNLVVVAGKDQSNHSTNLIQNEKITINIMYLNT